MPDFVQRLKRRKIVQWALGYLAGAFVALQLMDVLAEPLGLSLVVQRSILLLVVVGFLVVLVLAWHHGERGRQRLVGSELALIAGLVATAGIGLVVIAGGTTVAPSRTAPISADPTVAVLPLTNVSADSQQLYFAEGLTAAIHSELATLEGLRLVPRTSTLRFAGTDRDVGEIAGELGARYVLTGGVFKAGEEVRIDVQLSDADTGFDTWSAQFRGTLQDVLDFQAETALQIAEALGLELTAEQVASVRARYTRNVEAYDAYLRGWTLLESFHVRTDVPEDRLTTAREHFERAIELDAGFAPAIAGLSMVEGYHVLYGVDTSLERRERSLDLARRAFLSDSLLPEAHLALADAYNLVGQTERSIETFREATRLDPGNAIMWCHFAYACNGSGDVETAEEAARNAIRLYPTYYYSHLQLGEALLAQQRWDEAIDAYESASRLNPDATTPYYRLADIHSERERWEEALAVYERARAHVESARLLLSIGMVNAAAGREDEAWAALAAGLERGAAVSAVEASDLASHVLENERLSALLDRYREDRDQ